MEIKNPERTDGIDRAQLLKQTQSVLDFVYEKYGVQAHVTDEPVDLEEPFGAILWRRRKSMDFPICVVAELCGLETVDLFKMEMGWAMPREKYHYVMLTLMALYGFAPDVWSRILQKGLDCMDEKPMDLSFYLGLNPPAFCNAYRPAKIYRGPNPPLSYVRSSVDVVTRRSSDGKELPREVIWKDGRVFPVDRIDTAQESVRLRTGGVGTCFSCWLKGQQRNICYETPGEWFIETPCYAKNYGPQAV